MPKGVPLDLVGQQFGDWVVMSKAGSVKNKVLWKCQCSCGRTADVSTGNLRQGKSTRCRSCSNSLAHARRRAARAS